MNQQETDQFVQQLTASQNRLYGYIYSLLGDHSRAADVLQETNLVLWRKNDQFHAARPFLPWAIGIARYQTLAHLRDRSRDRLLLDDSLAEKICEAAETQASQFDRLRDSLRMCLGVLSAENRELINGRYSHGTPIADLADAAERTVASVKMALLRARRNLADCVQQRMAEGN